LTFLAGRTVSAAIDVRLCPADKQVFTTRRLALRRTLVGVIRVLIIARLDPDVDEPISAVGHLAL